MAELYYIQNKGYVGNCLLWWKVDGHGYTCNLDLAWKVTKEEADKICRSRPEQDIARRADVVDAMAVRHFDSEKPAAREMLFRTANAKLSEDAKPAGGNS